jgi:hypothetical protein
LTILEKAKLNKLQDLAEKAKKEESVIIVREIVEEMQGIIQFLITKE